MNSTSHRIRGVLAPVVTPFRADLSIDIDPYVRHCRALLADGVGLAIFGTNSEATSLSGRERMETLEQLVDAGVPTDRLMPGTGCCSIGETVELTRHALGLGVRSVLMLPPYFYKEASDEGLVAYYSEVVERVGADELSVYLYHIPQYTQVPITAGVIEGLLARYPGTIAGLKDSSGDWNNTSRMLNAFASSGFDIFCASEIFLPGTLELGGAGCISATANVNAIGLAAAFRLHGGSDGKPAQAAADAIRKVFQSRPMIAAMKHFLAIKYGLPDWKRVRPPLTAMEAKAGDLLMKELERSGFALA